MGDINSLDYKLDRVLKAQLQDYLSLSSCERLSGGASQETYCLTIETGNGERLLAMRRAPEEDASEIVEPVAGRPGLAAEAQLFQLARDAGVPEPKIYYVLKETDQLGQGFIMEWLEGEALGAKISRSEKFAKIRPQLAFQCGEVLARIHSIDISTAGLDSQVMELSPRDYVTQTWNDYKAFETPQPMIDFTGRWLMENLPEVDNYCLVHNDFRNGNIMMSPDSGIVAVLDWELAHIGDPMRDLGWICTNSWRFGKSEFPVGGFGRREDLYAGYESFSGRKVDPEHVKFWEVFGSFWWSVGCLRMADRYRHGSDPSVERPAIGRRSSECQIDCANLLIPGTVDEPVPGPGESSSAMPRIDELLSSVRDFLREDVMAETTGRTQFLSRVASNSVDIVLRELSFGPLHKAAQKRALESLMGEGGGLIDLQWKLVHALRDNKIAMNAKGLSSFLRSSVAGQIAIDQPKYSGYKSALNFSSE